jgi:hypothetical protein
MEGKPYEKQKNRAFLSQKSRDVCRWQIGTVNGQARSK